MLFLLPVLTEMHDDICFFTLFKTTVASKLNWSSAESLFLIENVNDLNITGRLDGSRQNEISQD